MRNIILLALTTKNRYSVEKCLLFMGYCSRQQRLTCFYPNMFYTPSLKLDIPIVAYYNIDYLTFGARGFEHKGEGITKLIALPGLTIEIALVS